MTDKEMIEEMARVIFERGVALDGTDFVFGLNGSDHFERIATAIYKAGYRKIPEGSVVLSKEVFEDYMRAARQVEEGAEVCYNCHNEYAEKIDQARKETTRGIITEIGEYLKRYSHIHKYAEEAKKTEEKYADGTPVEMESVWDVITLNKNGYADYDTMNKLQDNIENISLSRLLKEVEKDFRLFARNRGIEVEE